MIYYPHAILSASRLSIVPFTPPKCMCQSGGGGGGSSQASVGMSSHSLVLIPQGESVGAVAILETLHVSEKEAAICV